MQIFVVILVVSFIVASMGAESTGLSNHWQNCSNRWLFVASSGRSGSSTIMHMLNLIPGIAIGGENFGQLPVLAQNWNLVEKTQAMAGRTSAWPHYLVPKDKLVAATEAWLDAIVPSGEIRGFKEIRWQTVEPDLDPLRLFRFVREVLPCSKVIFSFRKNVTKQSESSFHKHSTVAKIIVQTEILQKAQETIFKSDGFLLPLEDFSTSTFNKLLGWLGVEGCKFKRILHTNKMPLTPLEGIPLGRALADSYGGDDHTLIDGKCSIVGL